MPAVQIVIPNLEGIVGSIQGTQVGASQAVADWVRMCKIIMLSAANKDFTNWEFTVSEDIDQTANVIRSGASTLYAFLIGYNAATAGGDLLCISNATSNTFSGAAALDSDDVITFTLPAAATEGTEELHAVLIPGGKVMDTGLTVGADAQGGTDPATDDVRGWFLYRSA